MENNAKRLPKTVLLITDHERLYGANRSLLDIAVYLRDRKGVKPIVLIQRPGRLSEALTELGIENHCILFRKWCYLPGDKKRFSLLRTLADRAMRLKILRVMAGKGIELVHTNVSTTCVGDEIARRLRVPHVWFVREFVPEAFPYLYSCPMDDVRKRFSRAAAVVAISKALQASFQRKFPDATVKMVYNGLNLTYGEKTFAPVSPVSFCCVGRLCPQKNQLQILQALPILKKAGKAFHVHFYGEGSDRAYEDGLYAYVKDNDLTDRVTFHGYSPNVVSDLAGYDVGLVVSSYEAFGRTTVEFMNASMPVIGADSGATPELIEPEKDGLICPLDDAEALARDMARFIDDPALIARMGKAAHEKAGANFSCETAFERICGVYADCLAAPKGAKNTKEG